MKPSHVAIGISLILGGCSIPPRNQPLPTVAIPASWSEQENVAQHEDVLGWKAFGSARLIQLIQEAVASNADLITLAQRVELARSEGDFYTAGGRPTVGSSTGVRVGKEHTRETGFETVDIEPWTNVGSFGWELDWLGKWRDRKLAAKQRVRASEADFNAGRLMLASEVATAWLRLRQHRAENEILDCLVIKQQQILAIYKDRYKAGIVEFSVVERQEAVAARLKQQQFLSQMGAETQILRLNRLLGGDGGERFAPEGILGGEVTIPTPPDLLPKEILRRRPDLVAVEARVREAFSLERAAYLDLFPALRLRFSGATFSSSLRDPFQAWMSNIGPQLDIPIWDPARLAQSKIHSARAKVIAAEYRAAILGAIEDVEKACTQFQYRNDALRQAEEIVRKAKSVTKQTKDKYLVGTVSQLELLEEEQITLAAQMSEWRVRTDVLLSAVAVIRSTASNESIMASAPSDSWKY